MKGWIVAGLAVAILLGAIWQGRKTRADLLDGNKETAAALERADERVRVFSEAYEVLAEAETAVRDTAEEAELRHERHEIALRGQLRTAIRNQAPALADSFDAMTAASDSSLLACRARCDSFEIQLKAAVSLDSVRVAANDTLRIDRDYWKDEALDLATDFSLNGWLPEGWIRTTGTIVMCGAVGAGVGVVAKSPEAGAGLWGGCTVAAFVF